MSVGRSNTSLARLSGEDPGGASEASAPKARLLLFNNRRAGCHFREGSASDQFPAGSSTWTWYHFPHAGSHGGFHGLPIQGLMEQPARALVVREKAASHSM